MERTKRYKTDGGDTAWEEKKKQSYATSEVNNHHIIGVNTAPPESLQVLLSKQGDLQKSMIVISTGESPGVFFWAIASCWV